MAYEQLYRETEDGSIVPIQIMEVGEIFAGDDSVEQAGFLAGLGRHAANNGWELQCGFIAQELLTNHHKELEEIRRPLQLLLDMIDDAS